MLVFVKDIPTCYSLCNINTVILYHVNSVHMHLEWESFLTSIHETVKGNTHTHMKPEKRLLLLQRSLKVICAGDEDVAQLGKSLPTMHKVLGSLGSFGSKNQVW